MAVTDRVEAIVEPLVIPLGLELVDVELNGGTLRVTLDKPGGLDMDALAKSTKAISHALDEDEPLQAAYTLEVSTPGLERRLRKPAHFQKAVGEDVAIKLAPHVEGERRVEGKLTAIDGETITVITNDGDTVQLLLENITKARTIFVWGPSPKPGKGAKNKKNGKKNKPETSTSDVSDNQQSQTNDAAQSEPETDRSAREAAAQ